MLDITVITIALTMFIPSSIQNKNLLSLADSVIDVAAGYQQITPFVEKRTFNKTSAIY